MNLKWQSYFHYVGEKKHFFHKFLQEQKTSVLSVYKLLSSQITLCNISARMEIVEKVRQFER